MAHIRSILPQRGGVSPVDNNTTALFHYDEHARDNLRGVRHIGEKKALYLNGNDAGPRIQFPSITGRAIEGFFYIHSNQTQHARWKYFIDFRDGQANSWFAEQGVGSNWINGKMYVNGNSVAVAYSSLPRDTWFHLYLESASTFTDDITLFSRYNYVENAKGMVEAIRIWNRALAEEEVKQLASGGIKNGDGLVGHWSSSQEHGTILYDTVNGNDAIVVQGEWVEGRAVYSLVSGGYPGGTGKGVFLEEGTSNILSSNNILSSGGSGANPSGTVIATDTSEQWDGYNSFKVIPLNTSANAGIFYARVSGVSSSSTYTFSVYLKGEGTHKMIAEQYDSSGVRVSSPSLSGITLTSNWQRYIFTFDTVSTTYGITMTIYTTSAQAITYWASAPQLEKKSFATSFTPGGRSSAQLAYPKEIIDPSVGTLSFWFNPLDKNPNANPGVVTIGGWTSPITKDWFSIYWGSGWSSANSMTFGIHNKVGAVGNQAGAPGIVINPHSWLFVVARWDLINKMMNFTVWDSEGIKRVGTSGVTVTPPTYEDYKNLYIGNAMDWTPNQTLNSIIDELRIDKVYRTDEEIAAWYYQGRNGW